MPTLFLDRDGVINRRKVGGYIENPSEFRFLPNVLEALALLCEHFSTIIIVTNQAGIAKGMMTEDDLETVHTCLLEKVIDAGGCIDAVYYCPHLASSDCGCRKPQTGMADQAMADFPNISFEKSVMIGDSFSDVQFGLAKGMNTFYVKGKAEDAEKLEQSGLLGFEGLWEFAKWYDERPSNL